MNRKRISDYFPEISIDNFQSESDLYFLTHFHTDHLAGLTETWNKGIVYCSETTKRLICHQFENVCISNVKCIEFGKIYSINEDLRVTLFPSKHLAGGAMFYFQSRRGNVFYTGDYKYYPFLIYPKDVDILFLDNTYHDKKLKFNTFKQSVDLLKEWLNADYEGTKYIGYIHLGTCELLAETPFQYRLDLDQKHTKMAEIAYPDLWNPASKFVVTHTHRRGTVLPLPIIIPSARYHLQHQSDVHSITYTDKSGKYRLNFTNHSNYGENIELIRQLNPEEVILIN